MAISRPVVMCLVLGVLFVPGAPAAGDQLLRYVDERGVAHWVMSKDQIPPKYRDKVESPDLPPANSQPPLPASRERAAERQRPSAEPAAEPQTEKQPPQVPWAR